MTGSPQVGIRTGLLAGVAIPVMMLAMAARAQPAQNAQPSGGQVSAGVATISQTPTTTTINQSSSRAVVDWRSFDIGSNQSVGFVQPSATAVTLNRVNSASPSQIAGKIDANGQVVIVNQSGVVFNKGAQVNAAGLVVSAAGITNSNFMAGNMVFDQAPSPNAKIQNDGTITIKEAGLAALVAPQVVNNGVIRAKMGHVILAGAQTHSIDLYGDGLLSLDVTSQVTQAPVGPNGKPVTALVTNNGLVEANGGTILLTASAADGVVQNLVTANGRAYADTIGDRTGTVVVRGTGGSIQILGAIRTAGRKPGTAGGKIEVNADGAVTVGDGARLNASGQTGGGVIAVGTTLARASGDASIVPTLVASSVTVASTAKLSANATVRGNGGKVVLLSTGRTNYAGSISAKGGATGGDGGTVEVSGATVSLTGGVDVSAPFGALGSIMLDPLDLTITASPPAGSQTASPNATAPNVAAGGQPDAATSSYITPAAIQALTGNVDLQATRDLVVNSPVTLTGSGQNLTLEAGRNLTVNTGAALSAPGGLNLIAANPYISGYVSTGTLTVLASLQSAGAIQIGPNNRTSNSVLGANITTGVALGLFGGNVTQTGGVITTPLLEATAGSLQLTQSNAISAVRQIDAVSGNVAITNASNTPLTITGGISVPTGNSITLIADAVNLTNAVTSAPIFNGAPINHASVPAPGLTASGGTVTIAPATSGLPAELTGTVSTTSTLSLTNAELALIKASTLQFGSSATGPVVIGADSQAIAPTTFANLSVTSGGDLTVQAPLTTNGYIYLSAGGALTVNAAVTGGGTVFLTSALPSTETGIVYDAAISATGTNPLLTFACDCAVSGFGALQALNGTIELGPISAGIDHTGNLFAGATVTANKLVYGLAHNPITGVANKYRNIVASSAASSINPNTAVFDLEATGSVTDAAGGVFGYSGTLTGSAGSVSLGNAQNQIGTLGAFTTSSGSFVLDHSGPLTVTGPISSAQNVSLLAAPGGTLTVNGTVVAAAGGLISLQGDAFSFGTAATGSVAGGTLELAPATPNQTLAFGDFTSSTGFVTLSRQPTIQTQTIRLGAYTDPNTGKLVTTAGTVRLAGNSYPLQLGGLNLDLEALSAITQDVNTPLLGVGTLTGRAGSVSLGSAQNQIGTLGAVTTSSGSFVLDHSGPLTVTGPISSAQNVSLLSAPGGTLTVNGTVVAGAGGLISLQGDAFSFGTAATGSVSGGTLELAPATLNQTLAFGDFTSSTGFVTLSRQPTVQTQQIRLGAYTDPNSGKLVTTAGTVRLAGNSYPLQLGGLNLDLEALGTITQDVNTPLLGVGTLTGRAGSVSLGSAQNQIGALGAFTTSSGSFVLDHSGPLTVTGAISSSQNVSLLSAPGGTLTVNRAVVAGAGGLITLQGDAFSFGAAATGSVPGGTLELAPATLNQTLAFGDFTSSTGFVTLSRQPTIQTQTIRLGAYTDPNTGKLVTTAGTVRLAGNSYLLQLGGLNLDLEALGTITQDVNTPLLGVGTLTVAAPSVSLAAPGNQITTLGAAGLAGGAVSLVDSVSITVNGPLLAGTLALSAPTATFPGLDATGSNIKLTLGSGTASGRVNLGALSIVGSGGSSNFTNSAVGGVTGSAAAAAATISPATNSAYLLNGCPIGVPNCGIVVPPVVCATGCATGCASGRCNPQDGLVGLVRGAQYRCVGGQCRQPRPDRG